MNSLVNARVAKILLLLAHQFLQQLNKSHAVSTALLGRIEAMEAENTSLKKHALSKDANFGMEQIKHDDRLVSFYTVKILCGISGFLSVPWASYEQVKLLGHQTKLKSQQRQRSMKLSPVDQLLIDIDEAKVELKGVGPSQGIGLDAICSANCWYITSRLSRTIHQ